jgi:hypothetical protein
VHGVPSLFVTSQHAFEPICIQTAVAIEDEDELVPCLFEATIVGATGGPGADMIQGEYPLVSWQHSMMVAPADDDLSDAIGTCLAEKSFDCLADGG